MFRVYPLIAKYLSGTAASGLNEAMLGKEFFGGETHVFSPAFREDEFDKILDASDHITFNSFAQLKKYGKRAMDAGKSCGVRVNPECSTQEGHEIYDPCAPFSRLGVTLKDFEPDSLAGVEGMHMHTLASRMRTRWLKPSKPLKRGSVNSFTG